MEAMAKMLPVRGGTPEASREPKAALYSVSRGPATAGDGGAEHGLHGGQAGRRGRRSAQAESGGGPGGEEGFPYKRRVPETGIGEFTAGPGK